MSLVWYVVNSENVNSSLLKENICAKVKSTVCPNKFWIAKNLDMLRCENIRESLFTFYSFFNLTVFLYPFHKILNSRRWDILFFFTIQNLLGHLVLQKNKSVIAELNLITSWCVHFCIVLQLCNFLPCFGKRKQFPRLLEDGRKCKAKGF